MLASDSAGQELGQGTNQADLFAPLCWGLCWDGSNGSREAMCLGLQFFSHGPLVLLLGRMALGFQEAVFQKDDPQCDSVFFKLLLISCLLASYWPKQVTHLRSESLWERTVQGSDCAR